MNPNDPSPLYDPHNRPLSKPKSDREALEDFVRAELAEAKSSLREQNQAELRKIATDQYEPKFNKIRKWSGYIIAALVVGNIVGWLKVPDRVRTEADRVINQKLIEPQLTNTLDNAISNRAVPYIVQQLHPLETKADLLAVALSDTKQEMRELRSDISRKQAELAKQQIEISDQQEIQGLLVESKGGSLKAFRKLETASSETNGLAVIAFATVAEIKLFFDAYRFRSYSTRKLVDAVSGKPISSPLDHAIVVGLAAPSWSQRETSIQQIREARKDSSVSQLCDSLAVETNLFVISDITRALTEITGQYFEALDTKSVNLWWAANKLVPKYKSPFGVLKRFSENGTFSFYVDGSEAGQAIGLLKAVIEVEPAAWWSRCLLGSSYAGIGDFSSAEKEFLEIEKGLPDYGILHFDKAWMYFQQGKLDQAIDSLNTAFQLAPSVQSVARTTFPKEFLADPRIHWP